MFLDGVLDLIYPGRCAVCGDLLSFETVGVCDGCKRLVEETKGIIVKNSGVQSTKKLDYVAAAYSVFSYTAVKKGIEDFKFVGVKGNGLYLGTIMERIARLYFPQILRESDMILYVPMYPKKEGERGFNQAEILAEEISRRSGVPIVENRIIRKRNTLPQNGLNKHSRLMNLKDAFQITDNGSLKNRRILLIDDINSTGATLNECAKVLLATGVKRVTAYTLATAVLEEEQ